MVGLYATSSTQESTIAAPSILKATDASGRYSRVFATKGAMNDISLGAPVLSSHFRLLSLLAPSQNELLRRKIRVVHSAALWGEARTRIVIEASPGHYIDEKKVVHS